MSNNRYEVIADYPGTHHVIGEIIIPRSKGMELSYSKYPHLFRLLKWWEHVSVDELPKYVKWGSGNRVHVAKIESYEFNSMLGNAYAKTNKGESLLLGDNDHPATEAEYTDYLTNLNSK